MQNILLLENHQERKSMVDTPLHMGMKTENPANSMSILLKELFTYL
jgi:hypothetical protein